MESSSSNVRVRVGKYELLGNLGSENSTTLKLAFDVETRRHVAIKVIDKRIFLTNKLSLGENRMIRKMNKKMEGIMKEITIMRMIKHPNVVGVIEVMATKTMIYIVMELVNGRELFQMISQTTGRGMTEIEARKYFQQLMCAVDYFHKRGVCHGNLKLENLMVDNNGTLKVTDFRKSAIMGPGGFVQTARGTRQYTAPEVIHSDSYNGTKADIWSCGVILFEMNAGYLPFMRSNNNHHRAVYDRTIQEDYTFPLFFSSRLRSLIQRILVPLPNFRISMDEIFEDEWFKQEYQPPTFPLDEESKYLLADTGEAVPSGTLRPLAMMLSTIVPFKCEARFISTKGPRAMNAFSMLSTFVGYDLVGNFFDQVRFKDEGKFISKSTTDTIMEAVDHVSASSSSGLIVKKIGYKMIINGEQAGRQGHLIIVTEISLMSPLVHMVEVRKVGGDTLEFYRFYNDLCTRLQYTILKKEPLDSQTFG